MVLRLKKMLENKNSPLFYFMNRAEVENSILADFQWPWYGQLMRRPQMIAWLLQIDFWLNHYKVELMF